MTHNFMPEMLFQQTDCLDYTEPLGTVLSGAYSSGERWANMVCTLHHEPKL